MKPNKSPWRSNPFKCEDFAGIRYATNWNTLMARKKEDEAEEPEELNFDIE